MLRKKKPFAEGIVLALLFSFLALLSGCQHSENETLKVTLLKVGKADAFVVRTGAQTMVIDAGEEDDGTKLVSFLESQGCAKVDTLIITHFDKDHVGGADTLVESMEIGRVLIPNYEGPGTQYQEFTSALAERDIEPQRLTAPLEFNLGGASVLVEPPSSYTSKKEDEDNDFSLITTVTHGKNRLLFAGDAEERRLREWLSSESAQDCDFLKIPHHGAYHKALDELLETVRPEYAVICSSDKNPADQETLALLDQYQVSTFQTRDGNVTVLSDGTRLEVSQKKK